MKIISADRLRFLASRLRDRLWLKPLVVCILSIAGAFIAKLADRTDLGGFVPVISIDSVETALSIMAASMLVIATFSVSSMVSAYASASSTATPRSFSLVVADDASQNALSTFVGAFIYSIVALTAVKNDYYETAGIFLLFVLTGLVFAMVIFTFVRWVDRIARLGRLGSTIEKVEQATEDAIRRRRLLPYLGGAELLTTPSGRAIYAASVGYVQHIDMAALQQWADEAQGRIQVAALPGTLAAPGRPLAYVSTQSDAKLETLSKAFQIGSTRLFDDDPRFGLVVLSEIASRALSEAINDPGTAIGIVGTLTRLFTQWCEPLAEEQVPTIKYERVEVPSLSINDMFDDAFTAIARDGAGAVEVAVRLQKALAALGALDNTDMQAAAAYHSQLALKRARAAMDIDEDFQAVQSAAI